MQDTDDLVEVRGWKGRGKTEIIPENDYYILREWRKHKHTEEVYYDECKVSKEAVDVLLTIIETSCQPREEYGVHFLWRKLIQHYKLAEQANMDEELMISVFNGGKLRAKYYFPLYHRPMKILEELGHIWYGGYSKTFMWLG